MIFKRNIFFSSYVRARIDAISEFPFKFMIKRNSCEGA